MAGPRGGRSEKEMPTAEAIRQPTVAADSANSFLQLEYERTGFQGGLAMV